ncbi:MAG: glycoside hydrolase family 20 zincin-like fold domain-containing protein, partial [Bacteroidales bacterium]|nr:glycoside hydrolase family 20 zincin-like fold domain-containing protein [Bacteroidales bacterium]
MKKLLLISSIAILLSSCAENKGTSLNANLDIIPVPQTMIVNSIEGGFMLNDKTVIVYDNDANHFNAEFLQSYLRNIFKKDLKIQVETYGGMSENKISNSINLNIVDSSKCEDLGLANDNEAYVLNVSLDNINIFALDAAGIFYGIQTLIQMMPNDIYSENAEKIAEVDIPTMNISDNPRF